MDYLQITPELLAEYRRHHFTIRARDNSMAGRGIVEGQILNCLICTEPEDGEIVVGVWPSNNCHYIVEYQGGRFFTVDSSGCVDERVMNDFQILGVCTFGMQVQFQLN